MGHANRFPNFLSLPPDSVLHPRFWNISCGFILYHPKGVPVFQVAPVIKNIGHVKRKFHEVIGGMRCGPACRWVQAHLDVRKTSGKRWLRLFNGKRILRDMFSQQLASRAGGLEIASVGAGLTISTLIDVLGRGHFEREFHKELKPGCVEPCAVSWSLFIKSLAQWAGGAAQSGSERWRRSWPTIVRPTKRVAWIGRNYSCITSQLLQDKHTWTFWPWLQERDVCTLLLTRSILGLPGIRAGDATWEMGVRRRVVQGNVAASSA